MARTISDLNTAIANLEAVLDSGASTVTQDGHTTVFDLDAAAERLRSLRKELAVAEGKQQRRPMFNRVNLNQP